MAGRRKHITEWPTENAIEQVGGDIIHAAVRYYHARGPERVQKELELRQSVTRLLTISNGGPDPRKETA